VIASQSSVEASPETKEFKESKNKKRKRERKTLHKQQQEASKVNKKLMAQKESSIDLSSSSAEPVLKPASVPKTVLKASKMSESLSSSS